MADLLSAIEQGKSFTGGNRDLLADLEGEKKNFNPQTLTNFLSAGKNPFGIPDFGPEASKAALETGGRLAYGTQAWLGGNIAKFADIARQKIGDFIGAPAANISYTPELIERTMGLTQPEAQLERGRYLEEQIGSAFGLIPPPDETVAGIMEETMKPIELVTTPLRKVSDWVIPDKYVNLQEFGNFAADLVTFKALHKLGKVGVKQLEKRFDSIDLKIKEKDFSGAETEAKEVLKSDEIKNLLDEIANSTDPIVKNLQENGKLPQPKEREASPLPQYQAGEQQRAARAAEETGRTNREAKEDFQRKQQLKEMLDRKVDEIRAKKSERQAIIEASKAKGEKAAFQRRINPTISQVSDRSVTPDMSFVNKDPRPSQPPDRSVSPNMDFAPRPVESPFASRLTIPSVPPDMDFTPNILPADWSTSKPAEVVNTERVAKKIRKKSNYIGRDLEGLSVYQDVGINTKLYRIKEDKPEIPDYKREFEGMPVTAAEAEKMAGDYADEIMRRKEGEKPPIEKPVEFTGPTFTNKADPNLERDYSVYGRKTFDDLAEAKKYLETNDKVQAERADLASTGHDLEIIKVGDKYRLAENLAATDIEIGLMDSIIESRDIPKYTMKETGDLVRDLQSRYEAGELSVYELQEGTLELSRSAQKSGEPDINAAMEKVLDVVNKEVRKFETAREEAVTPKEVKAGVFMAEHPTTGETIIYSPEGKPFPDALSAYDYMESMGIMGKGVVETVRRGTTDPVTGRLVMEEGYVVNPNKQPKPIKFTESHLDIREKHNRYRALVSLTGKGNLAEPFGIIENNRHLFNKMEVDKLHKFFSEGEAYADNVEILARKLEIKDLVDYNKKEVGYSLEEKLKLDKEKRLEEDRIDKALLDATKDQWERVIEILSKPLQNESGQITLTAAQTESLRKMVNEVLKSGKSIRAYFTELGYSKEQLSRLEEAVKAVGLKTLEENRNKSDYVNIGKMERKGREGIAITRPRISRKVAEDLVAAKDFKYKTGAGEFLAEHTTTVFKAEDSGSQYVMDLQPRIWEAEAMKRAALKAEVQKLKAISKGINNQSFDRIYTRALWNQERFQARMISDQLPKKREGKVSKEEYKKLFEAKRAELEKEMPVLTPEEMKVYKHMRSVLDDVGGDLFRIMAENDKDPITWQKNYFTIAYAEGLESLKQGYNTIYDPERSANYRGPLYEDKLFGSLKRRSKKGLPFALEKSAKKVLLNYLNNAFDYIHKQPLISELNEVLSDKGWDLGKRHLTASGKEKIDPYFLSREKPGLYKFLRRLNNQLAGRDPEAWGSWGPREEKIIRKITSNIAGATIGFLARTGLVQVSALKNTAGITGRYTFAGIYDALDIGKFKAARRESPFLRVSISDAELDAIFQGGVIGKTKRAATAHIKYMDAWTRTASYLAAKRYIEANNAKIRSGKLKGKIYEGKDLIWEAERITAKTQASGLATDIAPIQRSAAGKALYLLQTFTINDWNLFYKDILGVGKEGMSYRRRGMRLFNYALATAAVNTLLEDLFQINSPSPTPIKTIMRLAEEGEDPATITKEVTLDLLGTVPGLFGSLRYGSSTFGLAVDTVDSFVEAIMDDNWAKTAQTGGTLVGIQGTRQMYNMYKQYEQGEENPYRYIAGQPPNQPYKKKRRPSL